MRNYLITILLFLLTLGNNMNQVDNHIIETYANKYGINPNLILAQAGIESSGNGFEDNRIKIRVELYPLSIVCPQILSIASYNTDVNNYTFDQTFVNNLGETVELHASQDNEYEFLSYAAFLCDDRAYQYTSYGMFQILGLHFKTIGFPNAKLMYNFMSESPERDIQVYFTLLSKYPTVIQAYRDLNFEAIARFYNSQSIGYADELQRRFIELESEAK